jgi:hypothetical protein
MPMAFLSRPASAMARASFRDSSEGWVSGGTLRLPPARFGAASGAFRGALAARGAGRGSPPSSRTRRGARGAPASVTPPCDARILGLAPLGRGAAPGAFFGAGPSLCVAFRLICPPTRFFVATVISLSPLDRDAALAGPFNASVPLRTRSISAR